MVTEFIEDRWYKMTLSNENWYMKFKEISNKLIWCSEYIKGGKLNKGGHFGEIDDYDWKPLTDLSEIQQYLPKDYNYEETTTINDFPIY